MDGVFYACRTWDARAVISFAAKLVPATHMSQAHHGFTDHHEGFHV